MSSSRTYFSNYTIFPSIALWHHGTSIFQNWIYDLTGRLCPNGCYLTRLINTCLLHCYFSLKLYQALPVILRISLIPFLHIPINIPLSLCPLICTAAVNTD